MSEWLFVGVIGTVVVGVVVAGLVLGSLPAPERSPRRRHG